MAQSPNYTPANADFIMDVFREYIEEEQYYDIERRTAIKELSRSITCYKKLRAS